VDDRKRIFARQLLNHIPLAAHILQVLDERPSHGARKGRFLDELEVYMNEDDAERPLRAMINWGRYAETFAYDDENASLSPENLS
jgi:NitT/TauT family transport system ATP-binding protein